VLLSSVGVIQPDLQGDSFALFSFLEVLCKGRVKCVREQLFFYVSRLYIVFVGWSLGKLYWGTGEKTDHLVGIKLSVFAICHYFSLPTHTAFCILLRNRVEWQREIIGFGL
jgi:hypothetical protein